MIENGKNVKTQSQNTGESHKFAGDIVWFSITQLFISFILGIITLPALTKFYSSEIFGVWIQVNITVELISPLLSLQLGLAVVRFLAGVEDKAMRRQALSSMLSAIIVFTLVVCGAGLLISRQLSEILFATPEYTVFVNLIILWTFFNILFNYFLSYFRVRGKIKGISIIQMSITIIKMVTIVVLANAGSSMEMIIICMIVLQAVFTCVLFAIIIREIGFPSLNLKGLNTFLAYSVPQVPVVVLLWMINFNDRYFITHFLGLSQNGIYSGASTIAALMSIFYVPINFVLFPMISKLWEQRRFADIKSYFENSLRLFLTFAIPGAIGISMLSQALLRLLTTAEFLAGEGLIFLLTFGAIFLGIYQINVCLILLSKYARLVPLMAAAASITSVIINIFLIPRIGITGAASANCASYLVLATIITLRTRKIIKYNFNPRYLGKVAISSVAMLLVLYFLNINSTAGLILGIFLGAATFMAGLFISQAFSAQDKQLIKKFLGTFAPRLSRQKQ